MWLAVRLILAVIGFGVRQLRRGRLPAVHGQHEGKPYARKLHRNKREVSAISIGMPLRSPTWIRMHVESRFDRFFKRIGVANEIETGDAAFDARVYVTCDHPAVASLLGRSAALRLAIQRAFDTGARRVRYDGAMIWIDRIPGAMETGAQLDLLAALHEASAPLAEEPPRWFADRFLWKALAVEGVIWAIFGYAIGAFLEQIVHREDVHVRYGQIVTLGLAAAGVAFVALLVIIALWMRGSSRGHRVAIESAIVLALGLPVAGIQAVGDSNRALDGAPAIMVTRTVDHCEVREHRGRRGRRSYTYHLWLAATPERASGPALPAVLQVTRPICDDAVPGAALELAIGPGRWGIAWYRHLRVGGTTWTAPS